MLPGGTNWNRHRRRRIYEGERPNGRSVRALGQRCSREPLCISRSRTRTPRRSPKSIGRPYRSEVEKTSLSGMVGWRISTGAMGESVGGGIYRKMRTTDRLRDFIGANSEGNLIGWFRRSNVRPDRGRCRPHRAPE
jgi:hypothetical protein